MKIIIDYLVNEILKLAPLLTIFYAALQLLTTFDDIVARGLFIKINKRTIIKIIILFCYCNKTMIFLIREIYEHFFNHQLEPNRYKS